MPDKTMNKSVSKRSTEEIVGPVTHVRATNPAVRFSASEADNIRLRNDAKTTARLSASEEEAHIV